MPFVLGGIQMFFLDVENMIPLLRRNIMRNSAALPNTRAVALTWPDSKDLFGILAGSATPPITNDTIKRHDKKRRKKKA